MHRATTKRKNEKEEEKNSTPVQPPRNSEGMLIYNRTVSVYWYTSAPHTQRDRLGARAPNAHVSTVCFCYAFCCTARRKTRLLLTLGVSLFAVRSLCFASLWTLNGHARASLSPKQPHTRAAASSAQCAARSARVQLAVARPACQSYDGCSRSRLTLVQSMSTRYAPSASPRLVSLQLLALLTSSSGSLWRGAARASSNNNNT